MKNPLVFCSCSLLILMALAVESKATPPKGAEKNGAASRAECSKRLRAIGAACDEWALQHRGHFPKTMRELPGSSTAKLQCPLTGQDYFFRSVEKPDVYTISCGGGHSKEGSPPGFPQYRSISGKAYK